MTSDDFKEWRSKMNITQAKAGQLLGVTRETISHWERGGLLIPARIDYLCTALWLRTPAWSKIKSALIEEAKRIEAK